ncbi:hypothetical protein [Variovorax sp. GB1P17]|uniref:hypothetical protein n=1 Tax=Variovorax sp. GB1P17 TaxID=3443740 RepID=UPI003F44B5BB
MSDDPIASAEDSLATGEIAPAAVVPAVVEAVLDTPVAPPPASRGKRAVRRQVTTQIVDAAATSTVATIDVVGTEEAELPSRVTLAAPYAFYDDDGVLRSWLGGSVVEDPAEIALLVDRGVVFEAE